MLIKEFRIVMPVTVEEFEVGQQFATAQESVKHTEGGEGVEVIKNEPFDGVSLFRGKYKKGQYTHKIYHIGDKATRKVPALFKSLLPDIPFQIHEETWNAYPYCRTVLSIPAYAKGKFNMIVETMHYADRGMMENIHELPPDKLKVREVINIDMADVTDQYTPLDAKENPAKFKSQKTGRGPLVCNWRNTIDPVMTCYKLVTIEFNQWFGLGSGVEHFLMNSVQRLYSKFHRKIFLWLDEWHGMTMQDIKRLEEKTKEKLNKQRNQTTACIAIETGLMSDSDSESD